MTPKILIVEDSRSLAKSYALYLKELGAEIATVETGGEALRAIRESLPDVVLLDLNLPDMNGLEILERCRSDGLPGNFVVVTSDGSLAKAVEAMKLGALDFVVKPTSAERLRVTLRNALERSNLEAKVTAYEEEIDRRQLGPLIGASLAMQAVYRTLQAAATSKASIFVLGESGTGKELCAQAAHQLSPRAKRAFVALNCAAIPRDLMESEIFGHVRGAFTSADRDREGAAARAHGGTLFLDEICEMNLELQAKLLRFIQTSSFQKVGGSKLEEVDIRFVSATNRDPLEEVKAGRFREDLYYRLHVIPIEMPPLRDREEDIVTLAEHFLGLYAKEEGKRFTGFSQAAARRLLGYGWPGNVRELQNLIRQIVVLNEGGTVEEAMLPAVLQAAPLANRARAAPAAAPQSAAPPPGAEDGKDIRPLWQVERDTIESAIAACDGNVPRAAGLLEISPSTIYRKRAAWGMS